MDGFRDTAAFRETVGSRDPAGSRDVAGSWQTTSSGETAGVGDGDEPGRGDTAQSGDPSDETGTVAAASPPVVEPARVRFVAHPWAKITVDGDTDFHTPRAEPLELIPGEHTVTFEHPRYGSAEYVLDVRPGEDRLVRHVFDEAPAL
jgi:hypothetical protein